MRALLFASIGLGVTGLVLAACVGDEPSGTPPGATADAASTPDGATGPDGAAPVDAGADGTSQSDTGVDAGPRCDLRKPFAAPRLLPGLANTVDEETYGRISPDGSELYISKKVGADRRIYRATFDPGTGGWGVATEVRILHSYNGGTRSAVAATLTGDGKTLFMQFYDTVGSGTATIFTSTRPAASSTNWSAPTQVNVGGGNAHDAPWVNPAGTRLYFFNGNPYRIYVAERTAGGSFNGATAHPKIRDEEDRNPVLSSDELTLYFSSFSVAPSGGGQQMYVYRATRNAVTDNFANPVFVDELNTQDVYTAPTWLSDDGCTILLHSQRVGAPGSFDLFVADKPR